MRELKIDGTTIATVDDATAELLVRSALTSPGVQMANSDIDLGRSSNYTKSDYPGGRVTQHVHEQPYTITLKFTFEKIQIAPLDNQRYV